MAINTIDEFQFPPSASDLTDTLNKESSLKKFLLTICPNTQYLIRLLGPFVHVKRLYIPHSLVIKKLIGRDILKSISNGITDQEYGKIKLDIDNRIRKRVNDILRSESKTQLSSDTPIGIEIKKMIQGNDPSFRFNNDSLTANSFQRPFPLQALTLGAQVQSERYSVFKEFDEILEFFSNIRKMRSWQKSVFINAFVKCPFSNIKIKIVPFITSMCNELSDKVIGVSSNNQSPDDGRRYNSVQINGLYAYDIHVSKTGTGINTRYQMSLSDKSTFLEDEEIHHIMSNGLLDIPSIIKGINDQGETNYIYDVESDYKMPKQFESLLSPHMKKKEEDLHFDAADNEIDMLPEDAFEGRVDMSNPIASLEL